MSVRFDLLRLPHFFILEITGQLTKYNLSQSNLSTMTCLWLTYVSNPEAENHGEDDLTPGRSLVFGVMEICMCVLKKQLPNLLPQSGAFSQPPVLLVTINSGFKCKLVFKSDTCGNSSIPQFSIWTFSILTSPTSFGLFSTHCLTEMKKMKLAVMLFDFDLSSFTTFCDVLISSL